MNYLVYRALFLKVIYTLNLAFVNISDYLIRDYKSVPTLFQHLEHFVSKPETECFKGRNKVFQNIL